MESLSESSARLGFVVALRGCAFCVSRPAPNVFARSHYREALVAPHVEGPGLSREAKRGALEISLRVFQALACLTPVSRSLVVSDARAGRPQAPTFGFLTAARRLAVCDIIRKA